jgi:hypothetical protein
MVQEGVALMVKFVILSVTLHLPQNWVSDTYDVCDINTISV